MSAPYSAGARRTAVPGDAGIKAHSIGACEDPTLPTRESDESSASCPATAASAGGSASAAADTMVPLAPAPAVLSCGLSIQEALLQPGQQSGMGWCALWLGCVDTPGWRAGAQMMLLCRGTVAPRDRWAGCCSLLQADAGAWCGCALQQQCWLVRICPSV